MLQEMTSAETENMTSGGGFLDRHYKQYSSKQIL